MGLRSPAGQSSLPTNDFQKLAEELRSKISGWQPPSESDPVSSDAAEPPPTLMSGIQPQVAALSAAIPGKKQAKVENTQTWDTSNGSTHKVDNSSTQKSVTQNATPEEIWKIITQRAEASPEFKLASEDVGSFRDRLQNFLAKPQDLDLTPLLAYADAQTGSKTLSGYKAPMDADSRAVLAAKLQDSLSERSQGLQKIKDELMKNQLTSTYTSGLSATDALITTALSKMGGGTKIIVGNPPEKTGSNHALMDSKKILDMWNSTPGVKESEQGYHGALNTLNNLSNPSWLGQKMSALSLVQAGHLAPVSDLDVKSLEGGPSMINKIRGLYTNWVEGYKLTKEDQAVVKAWAKASANTFGNQLEDYANTLVSGLSDSGVAPDAIKLKIGRPKSGWLQGVPKSLAERMVDSLGGKGK